MDEQSWHIVAFALCATIAGIIMANAQYSRKKKEGIKINFTILKLVFGFAFLLWTAAALVSVYHSTSTQSTAIAGLFVGITLSIFFGWQINRIIHKIQSDELVIEELATKDALTGLWNRRIFHQTLRTEINRSDEQSHPLSLMMFDIDNLYEINVEYGYVSGDMVLRELAEMLFKATRKNDLICRYRSKEVAFILPDMDVQAASQFSESLQKEISGHAFAVGNANSVPLTVTIGITTYSEHTSSEPFLVAACEAALIEAIQSEDQSICVNLEPPTTMLGKQQLSSHYRKTVIEHKP